MWQILEEKIKMYSECGTDIAIKGAGESSMALAILTPTMKRIHKIKNFCQLIFVDSTSSCDDLNYSITFLLSSTPFGALPIGVLLSSGQSAESYSNGFRLLQQLVGEVNDFLQ